jgi:hypothetical protein
MTPDRETLNEAIAALEANRNGLTYSNPDYEGGRQTGIDFAIHTLERLRDAAILAAPRPLLTMHEYEFTPTADGWEHIEDCSHETRSRLWADYAHKLRREVEAQRGIRKPPFFMMAALPAQEPEPSATDVLREVAKLPSPIRESRNITGHRDDPTLGKVTHWNCLWCHQTANGALDSTLEQNHTPGCLWPRAQAALTGGRP